MNQQPLRERSKQAVQRFMPAKVIQSRLHRSIFKHFADMIGLVYFGYVDQRNDDHKLVRGFTVSAKHRDNHYCIGSFEGYDVTLVERSDTVRHPERGSRSHQWTILAVDLRTSVDLPHVFIGLRTQSESFYAHLFTKFSKLSLTPLGIIAPHDPQFVNRYAVYTEPTQTVAVEYIFTPAITKVIADRFGSLTIELSEGCLYVYAEHQRPTTAHLERMLQYGIWLAKSIDSQASQLR
jgi:hypothetical protein